MKINIISQTDSKWKNKRVGTGAKTIGQVGCLLCSMSMINGKSTPDDMNVASNFQDGNLWIWASLNKYGGKYNGRYNYSKARLNQLVNKYGAVVVAVKDWKHFVVYTKSGKVYDPLGGKILNGFGSYVPCAIYDQKPNKDGYVEEGTISKPSIPTNKPTEGDFEMKTYKNGSTPEIVYQDTAKKVKIGSLNPYESCECYGKVSNMYIVSYKVDGTNYKKVGYVVYNGGI